MSQQHTLILIVIIAVHVIGLKYRDDGRFKIVQFTDMHLGEDMEKDLNTRKVQMTIINAEKPDLIVVSGDTVSGYAYPNNSTCMRGGVAECWAFNVKAYLDTNSTWAFTFGNHDDQGDLNRAQIMKIETAHKMSLTKYGPSDITGSTNYVLNVESSRSTTPSTNLYFFDSSDDNCLKVKGWGCIYPDQVEWYRKTSIMLRQKYGKVLPSLAFFHIPLPEHMNVLQKGIKGNRTEDICCFSVNTGIYSAILEMGDIKFLTVGHDHNNDYVGDYNGIQLAYGRKTGYGGYGPPANWLRGARVIELIEDPFQINTWIRQEDGTKIIQIENQNKMQQNICCGAAGNENHIDSFSYYIMQQGK